MTSPDRVNRARCQDLAIQGTRRGVLRCLLLSSPPWLLSLSLSHTKVILEMEV
jgi:hypothetical protein